jgi:hypothetical protein
MSPVSSTCHQPTPDCKVIGAGYLGVRNSMASILAPPPEHAEGIMPRPAPLHRAAKATVAVLLGNTPTEIYGFPRPLRDVCGVWRLQRNRDVASVKLAAKRLEVRDPLNLVGQRWPLCQTIEVALSGLVGLVVFHAFRRTRFIKVCDTSPLLARRGAEHIKRCCEATSRARRGGCSRSTDRFFCSNWIHHPVCAE